MEKVAVYLLDPLHWERELMSAPPEVWHNVARHMGPLELCQCMGVSRAWFGAWVVDSAWVGQRARICAMWPALAELFESCAGREIASVHSKPLKRRRKRGGGKRIVIPQRGIWYTFKEWLSRWTHE